MLTAVTMASPRAAGRMSMRSAGLQVKLATGGNSKETVPTVRSRQPRTRAATSERATPNRRRGRARPAPRQQGGGARSRSAPGPGAVPCSNRAGRAPARAGRAAVPSLAEPARAGPAACGAGGSTIIAPTPHEKPETTACGTLATYRPRRSTEKIIRKTDAARQTLAAPATPSRRTAPAMNGTVALAVPPISTGFRPSSAVIGAVRIDVNSP